MEITDNEQLIELTAEKRCFRCRAIIPVGRAVRRGKFMYRHTFCNAGVEAKKGKSTISKRRRAGGHGYFGGNGWVKV
jgi:hypothetical protein